MAYALTQKGQVTLPKPVRERLALHPGDEVDFRLNDRGEVVVEKSKASRPDESVSRWRGFFGPGLTTDEVMALTRDEDQ